MTQHLAFIIYTFLLIIFEEVSRTQMSLHNNGFIQSTNEVRYFVDDISTMHKDFPAPEAKITQEFDDTTNSKLKSILKFDPDILDFKHRTMGVPHREKVTVTNLHNNKTIVMTSLSGDTVHFHSSFFDDKVIPPLGNTTFSVVFLARQQGLVESVIHLHTSEGSVNYKIKGAGALSPYRLRPLINIHLPLNASFSPIIYMHNPHPITIQIVEVYSSGGEFHLELPTGELEGPKNLWEIPPHQTRPIIRVRFHARIESNHTAYVRVKLNNSEEVLLIPLEVEIGAIPGLHAEQGTIDFGIGGSLDSPKQVKLFLQSTLKKPIRIQSIIPSDNNVVNVEYQTLKIHPFSKTSTLVALLNFDWKAAFEAKHYSGELLVKSKQLSQDLIIPYWATVIPGGLAYNASAAHYLLDKSPPDISVRKFTIKNLFPVPVAVINVTLPSDAQQYFAVHNFSRTVLHPNQTTTIFNLRLKQPNLLTDFNFQSNIFIYTNISTVEVPLLSYDGKLKKIIPFADPSETVLDLGLIGVESSKNAYLTFLNLNPTVVDFKNWSTDLKGGKVKLIGCGRANSSESLIFNTNTNLSECKSLQPMEYALFVLSIVAPKAEGQYWGEIIVETQYEQIVTPITVRVAYGNFEAGSEKTLIDNCFPSKICSHPLRVHSTFPRGMDLVNIISLPPDPRLGYRLVENDSEGSLHISPRAPRIVAHLNFDPSIQCFPNCYSGFPINSTTGAQWLDTLSLPYVTKEFDENLLDSKYGRYLNLTLNGMSRWQNLTLRLDTTEVKNHLFNIRVKMTWPKLVTGSSHVNRSYYMFPVTQIGNISYQTITLRNPSASTLVFHVVMDWMYPNNKQLFDILPNAFKPPSCSDCSDAVRSTFFFAKEHCLQNTNLLNLHNVTKHKESVILLLKPGETTSLRIGFNASSTTLRSALVYIRNNLTVLEVIRISGQGAHPALKFGNRKPGSNTPLLFELVDKHLKDCEKEKARKNPSPNLTVKRSFTARNIGDISIYFKGFYINGYPCEGYGFKVLNCEAFHLLPNETRKVEIAFTPDFTLAKIQRTLIIDTSLGIAVNYTLLTTVPPSYLAPCSSVLARPPWEAMLYWVAVISMTFLFVCIIVSAFMESDRILHSRVASFTRDTYTLKQPLDLRLIGTQTRNEVRSHKVDTDTNCVQTVSSLYSVSKAVETNSFDGPKRHRDVVSTNNNICNTKQTISISTSTWDNSDVSSSVSLPKTQKAPSFQKLESNSCVNLKPVPVSPVAITPSTVLPIKNKKKLSKKNSNESETTNVDQVETILSKKSVTNMNSVTKVSNVNSRMKTHTLPSIIGKQKLQEETPVKKVFEDHKENKRHVIHKKRCQEKPIVCSEEETSSTTTESSNNEDGDKENVSTSIKNEIIRKSVPKKSKSVIITNDFRDCYEGDDEDCERVIKSSVSNNSWKSRHESKSTTKTAGSNSTTPENFSPSSELIKAEKESAPHKRSTRTSNRERKEKTIQKKRYSEKSGAVKIKSILEPPAICKPVTQLPQIAPPSNCWGENRARFSDVVARSDSTVVGKDAKRHSEGNSPTFHSESNIVDPVKLEPEYSNVHLGPIGSKKSTVTNDWEPSSLSHSTVTTQANSSNDLNTVNSFVDLFSNNFMSQLAINDLTNNSDLWDSESAFAMLNQYNTQNGRNMLGDYHPNFTPNNYNFTRENNWSSSNSNGAWGEHTYVPSAVGEERQQQQQRLQQRQANYDFSWEPPPWSQTAPPVAPGTPTRSPPGFPSRPQTDESETISSFDPFRSFSNIWSPPRPPS